MKTKAGRFSFGGDDNMKLIMGNKFDCGEGCMAL